MAAVGAHLICAATHGTTWHRRSGHPDWLNRTDLWPGPDDSYAMVGAGGPSALFFPTHDLVVVLPMGEKVGSESGDRALKLILEAVPQARPAEPPFPAKR